MDFTNEQREGFTEIFKECVLPQYVWERWEANSSLASSAAAKIWGMGGNPWVFAADEHHFEQFAGPEDRAAMAALSPKERDVLLGPEFWTEG